MSPNTYIDTCPVCGKNALHITKDANGLFKHFVCAECKFEHKVEKLDENVPYVQNLFFLKFFGNTHEHIVDASDLHTLADAEYKAAEIEQINGIQSIKIIIKDEDLNLPLVITGTMSQT